MSKSLLDGSKAKYLFGEVDAKLAENAELLLAALGATFKGDTAAAFEALHAAMSNNAAAQRIVAALKAGRPDEAEALIAAQKRTKKG